MESNFEFFALEQDALYFCTSDSERCSYKEVGEKKSGLWKTCKQAVKINDTTVLVACNGGVYSLNLKTGQWKTLNTDDWSGTQCAIAHKGKAIFLTAAGVYAFDPKSCKYDTLNTFSKSSGWDMCKIGVTGYVAYDSGIYKMNLDTGKFKILCKANWSGTRRLLTCNGYLYAFHKDGLFKINPSDGKYEKIGSSKWSSVVRSCSINFGTSCFVFCSNGIYWVNLSNGAYSHVEKGNWSKTMGVFHATDVMSGGRGLKLSDPEELWTEIGRLDNSENTSEGNLKRFI